jgi:hypothetical protein
MAGHIREWRARIFSLFSYEALLLTTETLNYDIIALLAERSGGFDKGAHMNLSRRSFLGGAVALGAFAGCRNGAFGGERPLARVGVISDIHLTDPASTVTLASTLAFFRDSGVDAVLIAGDLSDWGLLSGFKLLAKTWNEVFPGGLAPDGRRVEKLFCTGNHDFEGWWYPDMTMEMHALGYSEDEACVKLGMKKCWEEAFDEPYAPVRDRLVNGLHFVSAEYDSQAEAAPWLEKHAPGFDPAKPFFFFSHEPLPGTVSCSPKTSRHTGAVAAVLARFPNAVALAGHCHRTFNDERSIWQGAFTALAIPSLSYTSVPRGYENGSGTRDGKCAFAMPRVPSRAALEEAQGFLMDVFPDRIDFIRRDFTVGCEAAAPWSVPWPPTSGKPYAPESRAAAAPAPQFPKSAVLRTYTRNEDARNGHWQISMVCEFPLADAVRGARAWDYEVQAVLGDGTVAMTKRFISPAAHKLPEAEPSTMHFSVNVAELPQDANYRLLVRPRNCFGTAGEPLVSAVRRGRPGLDKAKR